MVEAARIELASGSTYNSNIYACVFLIVLGFKLGKKPPDLKTVALFISIADPDTQSLI